MLVLLDGLNTLILVIIAVSPTVFVFSVTLLGDAIERAQSEEKSARENEKESIKQDIARLEFAINAAKQNGDVSSLTVELDSLKKRQKESDRKIGRIKIKYKQIDFYHTVLYPISALVVAYALGLSGREMFDISSSAGHLVVLSQFSLTLYATLKILASLHLVQEISANKKESEALARLKEAFKSALEEHASSSKEQAKIEYTDKAFPLNVAPGMELSIDFRVKLVNGSVLHNAEVWFYVADGIGLIDPPEARAWQQTATYDPPLIRTVKKPLGTLSKGPAIPRTIKIRTPSAPGKFLLRSGVKADGYFGALSDQYIIVGQ